MPRAAAAGTLLQELLAQWGMTGKLQAYQAWQVWDEVVGPQIAAHARPARIRDGVLEVRVDQAVWMQQLQLLKPKLLTRLNERLGDQTIRDIFWRRGTIEPPPPPPSPDRRLREVSLSRQETERISQTVAGITDPELRAQMARFYRRQLQLEKASRDED